LLVYRRPRRWHSTPCSSTLRPPGGHKLLASVRNTYAMGKVRMAKTEFENAGRLVKNRNAGRGAEAGRFVLWQMAPEMWNLEMAVGGSKVHSGCDGTLSWRHAPSSGAAARAAKGPVRPLRRALQVCAVLLSLFFCDRKRVFYISSESKIVPAQQKLKHSPKEPCMCDMCLN
jgi:hypothetical protein